MQKTATVGFRYAVETNQVSRDGCSGANRANAACIERLRRASPTIKMKCRIPQGTARSNNKAADRTTRGLIAMLLGWYPNVYSFAGVTLFLTLVPTAICCPGHR